MAMNGDFDREITFEITEQIGVLTSYPTGWKKELNLVKWNGANPKYDIRDWDPEHAHMSRGVTLHEKEMRLIFELLKKRRPQEQRRVGAADEAAAETKDLLGPDAGSGEDAADSAETES